MSDNKQDCMELARKAGGKLAALPGCSCVMVTGSTAKGITDDQSDVDMTAYYEGELPSDELLDGLRSELGGGEIKWTLGERSQGSFAQAWDLGGREIQIGHTACAAWEQTIDAVLLEHDIESPAQKAMEGTLNCIALHGEKQMKAWQERIAAYPRDLSLKMIRGNLGFFPLWRLEEHFRTRDAELWYNQELAEAAYKIVAILSGLNRLYWCRFQFKRTTRHIGLMEHTPRDLANRLNGLFRSPREQALPELKALVRESLELVAPRFPEIELEALRARLAT